MICRALQVSAAGRKCGQPIRKSSALISMCYTVFLVEDAVSKYQPLTDYLRRSGAAVVPMTFEQVERLIGAKLPPTARKRAWWSNNPTNNVMTKAWLAAGYESTRVDMTDGRLVFRLTRGSEGGRAERSDWFAAFHGGLRGTVTIAPGTDLTAPTGEAWDAERDG